VAGGDAGAGEAGPAGGGVHAAIAATRSRIRMHPT
jgi:hypothetical protein